MKEQVEKNKKIIYNIYTRLRDEYPESTEHGETPLKALTKVMKLKCHLLTTWVGSSVWSERAPVKRDVIGSNPILPAKKSTAYKGLALE